MRLKPLVPASLLAIGILLFLFYQASNQSRAALDADLAGSAPTASVSFDEFGLPGQGFSTVEDRIPRNATFSDLLTPYGVPYERIVTLAQDSRSTFDVRRLKSARPYRVYMNDSTNTARYLVYEPNVTSYVVFDLAGSGTVRLVDRPVETRLRTVEGTITSSLYVTLMQQDIHPAVATRMSEVFAWQIDFYRIQKGDSFRIIFEEEYIGDEAVGVGDILAARFKHFGSDFYAFRYVNEEADLDEHYDQDGNSLRKAFLIAPVEYSRISSGYSGRRFHPVQKRYKAHLGTDYAADRGTPIKATGDGIVTEATFGQYNGNYVKIRHNSTYTTQYLHMSRIASGMRPGVKVKQGQVIGYVGATGLATGNHVCYRFWMNGQQVDHRRLDIPSVGPIPDSHRASFDDLRNRYRATLDAPFMDSGLEPSYAMLLGDFSG
ncbi:MAG: peptidoglycan DD-metalloendopeptidase family protein [Rhodothermales bacterium]